VYIFYIAAGHSRSGEAEPEGEGKKNGKENIEMQ